MIRIEEHCLKLKNRGKRPHLEGRLTGVAWWSSWFSLASWLWQLRSPITIVGNTTRAKERRERKSGATMKTKGLHKTETSLAWLKTEIADGTSK
jgi:hypothetical protein